MARPLRVQFPGAIYHVTSRRLGGWNKGRELLFRDESDYRRFLKRLQQGVLDFGVRLYLFCLMSNHFHLLVETPQQNISAFMHNLATAYTVYFNRRHRRHGHLLDGRFKARLVSGDAYLLKLSRYVHLNPVCVASWAKRPLPERLVHLRDFPWSSYPGYAGWRKPVDWIDEGPVLAMMSGGSESSKRKAYRQFVESGLAETDEEFLTALNTPGLAIGNSDFRQWVERQRAKALHGIGEKQDISFRRVVAPLSIEAVLDLVTRAFGVPLEELRLRRRGSVVRLAAAHCLMRYSGLTHRQIAKRMGLTTGAAVGAQLKLLEQRLKQDPTSRKTMEKLDKKLRFKRDESNR